MLSEECGATAGFRSLNEEFGWAQRRAGPFAHATDGLSRPFLAVAMASAANRPFDTLSASPMPGRQNFADDLDTLAHAKVGPSRGRTRRLR